MYACIGHLAQPVGHFRVGGDDIELLAALRQALGHWNIERAAQIAVETLDLGLGAVWLAQLDDKAAMFGVIREAGLIPLCNCLLSPVSKRTAGPARGTLSAAFA